MNQTNSCLERLFRAAARAPHDVPAEAPFYLECVLLAAWRDGVADESPVILMPLLRWAFVCACAILAITAALTFHALTEAPPSELVVVDSAIQLTLLK